MRFEPAFRRSRLETTLLAWVLLTALVITLAPPGVALARERRWQRAWARRAAGEAFVAQVARVTVRAGDTLWDLCARHTGKPWVWPQVWAINPQLTNPHWLTVGSTLALRPDGLATPAVAGHVDVPPSAAAQALAAAAPPPTSGPAGAAEPRGSAAGAPPLRPTLHQALFAGQTLAALPRVQRTLGEANLARQGQHLAVQPGSGAVVRTGEWYVTLQPQAPVDGAGSSAGGVLVAVTGIVRPTLVDRHAEVVLEHLYGEVEGGQLLAPLSDFVAPPQSSQDAPASLQAEVLAVEQAALVAGGGKLAFVAAGRSAGLVPGMRLWLMDPLDPAATTAAAVAAPTPVGELQVLQVQRDHCTCAIVYAAHEVFRGQRVVGGHRNSLP